MTNGYDPKTVASFVNRIEILKAELKEAADEVGQQIKAIRQEAMDSAGIPLKALQMVLRERALRTKIDALAFDDSRALAQLLGALDALEERPPDVANGAAKRSTASQAAVRTY